jgi:flagella basal body P-ring formation protein FlgA
VKKILASISSTWLVPIVTVATAVAFCCHSAGAVVVELYPQAEQRGSMLRLDAVASVFGDAREQQLLVKIELPPRGRVGDTVIYTQEEIAARLAPLRAQLKEEIHVVGADRVRVDRLGQVMASADYIEAARTKLLTYLDGRDGRISVRASGDYRPLSIPIGTSQIVARIEQGPVRARMKVWLDIAVDGHYYASIPVVFAVSWLRSALILNRAHKGKSALAADALSAGEVDAALVGGELVKDAQQLRDKRLRHDMDAGAALRLADIEDKPPVEAGSKVDVFAHVGRIVVQTKAVAQRDGFVGQRIGARLPKTQELLMVEVIGEDRAIVSNNTR